jgi:hypothetical protein
VVMVTSIVPCTTSFRFAPDDARIFRVEGRCRRVRNSSLSASDRRSKNKNGIIRQPTSSGMRHPNESICAFVRAELSTTPINAANTTAHCWLADCHDTIEALVPRRRNLREVNRNPAQVHPRREALQQPPRHHRDGQRFHRYQRQSKNQARASPVFIDVRAGTKAHRGRIRNPTPNVANADISWAGSLPFGKKDLPMAAAYQPNTMKWYISRKLPAATRTTVFAFAEV